MSDTATARERVRVWDLPTRIAHWSIVTLFAGCWWTASEDRMHWHRACGYGLLVAVVFRVGWGIAGSQTSRFADFVRSPAAVWRYLRTPHQGDGSSSMPIGHNPLGGWSIIAMLGSLLLQALLGLFSVAVDGVGSGPWSRWVSYDVGRRLARMHGANFDLLLALVALHLGAILFYAVARKDNLVPAMLHGVKSRARGEAAPRFVSSRRAVLLAAAVVAAVAFLVSV